MSAILNALTNEVVELLLQGKVGVIPTDTIYGVVCKADNQEAVERLYRLKHRHHKPGTIIAADTGQLIDLGLKARYLKAVEHFWPNPLSVIIPTGQDLAYLHLDKQSLAVRIPKDEVLLKFLRQTGPLLTSSANHPGEKEASTIGQAKSYFAAQVDFYVDGGDLHDHKSSTVIRVIDDAIEILRQGAVTIDESGRTLG